MINARKIAFMISWIGLIWIVLREARERPLFENPWLDVGYGAGMVLLVTLAVVSAIVLLNRYTGSSNLLRWSFAALIVLLFAAIDVFWLREYLAQP